MRRAPPRSWSCTGSRWRWPIASPRGARLRTRFFLTVNTGLAALLGGKTLRWYVAAAGIVFALAWWWLLQSYRKLNSAKFKVINAIESDLPVHLFTDEWTHLENPRRLGRRLICGRG